MAKPVWLSALAFTLGLAMANALVAEDESAVNNASRIAYLELSAPDLAATKAFFTEVFAWEFTDWGPDYADTPSAGVMVGFYRGASVTRQESGGAVLGFYSDDLEASVARIEAAGGTILRPTYGFPGGERFHFLEPSGNEFIVYTATGEEETDD